MKKAFILLFSALVFINHAEDKVLKGRSFESAVLSSVNAEDNIELFLSAYLVLENYFQKQGNIKKLQEYQAYIYECRLWIEESKG